MAPAAAIFNIGPASYPCDVSVIVEVPAVELFAVKIGHVVSTIKDDHASENVLAVDRAAGLHFQER